MGHSNIVQNSHLFNCLARFQFWEKYNKHCNLNFSHLIGLQFILLLQVLQYYTQPLLYGCSPLPELLATLWIIYIYLILSTVIVHRVLTDNIRLYDKNGNTRLLWLYFLNPSNITFIFKIWVDTWIICCWQMCRKKFSF